MQVLFNQVLNGDCFEIIAKFLDPMDFVNLARSKLIRHKHIKRFQHWFKLSATKNIDNWFRDYFGKDYNEFKSIMIQYGGVISGSFVMQMIIGENWPESDIDIFFPTKYFNRDVNLFHPMEVFLYKTSKPFHDEEEARGPLARYTRAFDTKIRTINEYEVNANTNINTKFYNAMKFRKFQVIGLRVSTIQKVMITYNNNVDIDICKNFFSYNTINLTDGDCSNLKIVRLNELINRKATMKFSNAKEERMKCARFKRYVKYCKRGFKFTNNGHILKLISEHDMQPIVCYDINENSYTCRCGRSIPIL